ncbi:hypothetical protein CMI38_00780 [Candidatus Pacearchaeota archaeon]|nr:hypothetical protein [Candidatus Pacearchaeota archaeon]
MEKKEEIIKLRDVAKFYHLGDETIKAVDGIDISVYKGDFIAIVGPSGSGKCVTGDTEIILEDGSVSQIRDIEYMKTLSILGLDKKSGKIKNFKVNNLYKREVSETLMIKTTSGKKITVTKDHPFFTINDEKFSKINAKDIRKGIFIATPRKLNVIGKKQYLNTFEELSQDKTLIIANSVSLMKNIRKRLKISRKEICEKFNFNLGTYDSWYTKNNISLHNFSRILGNYGKKINNYEDKISLTGYCSGSVVNIPKYTSKELLELYGFLVGDGNLDNSGAKITNIDQELRNRIKFLVVKLFNVNTTQIEKRIDINKMVVRSFFINIFDFPLKTKSWNVKVPDFVFKCSNEEIAGFIRGLFDCDGTVSKNKREMSITLASEDLIKQLQTLFLRFGIHTRYSEKIKYASNTEQKIKRVYHHLSISGYNNLSLFEKEIGFNSQLKKRRLSKHLKNSKQNTNVDIVPCGELIRTIRKKSGVSVSRSIHKMLGPYEVKMIHPSNKKLKEIIKLLKNNNIDVREMEKISKMEIFWDKVVSIDKMNRKETVYDLTVPYASNFVANGFVIHNSTAMNMVGALDIPSKGNIYLDRNNIAHLHESELAQIRGRKIGFVFQTFNLIPTLTAIENVMLPMIFQGVPIEERRERAGELLSNIGMGHRLDHLPSELSGGERQRVAVSRALANDPEVILADEPTGNLDSKRGEEIAEMFHRLSDEGKTIILVTHDDEIASHADKIYKLKDGKIVNGKKS